MSAIQACSAQPAAALSAALAQGEATALLYPRALLRVLVNVRDVRVIQYTLTLLCDFLQADVERRSRHLLAEHGELTLTSLLQLVGTTGSGARITSTDANPYVLEYAARAASLLLSVDAPAADAARLSSITSLVAWVQSNLRLYGSPSPKQVKVTEVRARKAPHPPRWPSARFTLTHTHTHTHPTPPPTNTVAQVAVESLMILLRSDELKVVFLSLDNALPCLVAILSTQNTQLLYDALHCLWLVSLKRAHHGALERARAPLHVLRALRPGQPLKVTRAGLGLLVNLMKNPQCSETMALVVESASAEAVLAGLAAAAAAAAPAAAGEGGGAPAGGAGGGAAHASAGSAGSSSSSSSASASAAAAGGLGDPELAEDARWAREAIAARGGRFGPAFSNVERYVAELQAGVFHWTPLHTPQFWKENARHFERDACSLLKQLAQLITVRVCARARARALRLALRCEPPPHNPSVSYPHAQPNTHAQNPDSEDVTIAVALFDAGEFAVAHPQGRALAASTGLKDAVLLHLEAKRKSLDDVKQQALMAMSKLIRA